MNWEKNICFKCMNKVDKYPECTKTYYKSLKDRFLFEKWAKT